MKSALLTTCIIFIIEFSKQNSAIYWNATHCDEQCECLMVEREIQEQINSYINRKTVNCNGRKLEHLSVLLPDDVEVLKANENRFSDFNNFTWKISKLLQLSEIEISDNEISNFNSKFVCPNVSNLDVSNNNVSTLNDRIFVAFPNLRYLKIQKNVIANTENSLCQAKKTKLQSLILSYNKIDSLTWLRNCKRLQQLHFLDISENKLKDAILRDYLFSNLSNLKSLTAEGMQISEIEPNAFSGLKLLEVLDLDNNWLTVIPSEAIAHTPNIQTLSLNGNYIIRIGPNAFYNFAKLRLIELSRLFHLQVIDQYSFNSLPYLETLLLFNNRKLSYIDGNAFSGCSNLLTLDVHNTMIETILVQTINSLPLLKKLNFKHNPINCNSLMNWAKQWTSEYEKDGESGDFTCARPPKFRGSNLNEVDLESYKPVIPAMQPTFPHHKIILPNINLILNCRAFGNPKPEIKWVLPNGEQVNSTSSSMNGTFVDECGTLTVTRLVSGRYKCIATNQQGVATREVLVQNKETRKKLSKDFRQPQKKQTDKIQQTATITTVFTRLNDFQFKSVNQTETIQDKDETKIIHGTYHRRRYRHNFTCANACYQQWKTCINMCIQNNEIRTTVPNVKMHVPELYFLEVTPTSVLITWSNNDLHESFQLNYHQKMKISLENERRILFESFVEPFWIMNNKKITTSEYNISSLEPGEHYEVCITLECCIPKHKKKSCSSMTTPKSKHISTQALTTFSTTAGIIIAVVLTAMAAYFGKQCYVITKLNKNDYEKVENLTPLEEIYKPLLQTTTNTTEPQRLIKTTATTSLT